MDENTAIILQDIVRQINVTAGYGYTTMVHGTYVFSVLDALCVISWIALSIGVIVFANKIKDKDPDWEGDLFVIVGLIFAFLIPIIIGQVMRGIIDPQAQTIFTLLGH